ncbi:MAG: hypothetical protein AB1756_05870 [Acidobacteriota bacterium]
MLRSSTCLLLFPFNHIAIGGPVHDSLAGSSEDEEKSTEGKLLYAEKEMTPVPEHLMEQLIRKSAEYETFALKFTCTELIRKASYSIAGEEATKEKLERYEYLLEANPGEGSFSPYRVRLESQGGRSPVTLELRFPEAYPWVFIFSKNYRNVMRYGYIGKEIYAYKLAHIIAFRGFQPFTDGRDIREWEGRIWVEEKTFNVLKVEAQPIHQDDILELKRQEYNQAFSFIGIKLKKKPLGYSSTVYFDFEHEGLTFPTQSDNRTFELVARNKKVPTSALILSYADYHFFKTETRERIKPPS